MFKVECKEDRIRACNKIESNQRAVSRIYKIFHNKSIFNLCGKNKCLSKMNKINEQSLLILKEM